MPNRGTPRNWQPAGGRKPMQTTPDDDEAQVMDQTHLADDESVRDAPGQRRRADAGRLALQPGQAREGERSDASHPGDTSEPQQARRRHDQEFVNEQDLVTRVEDEEGEADEDEKDGLGPRP